MFKEKNIEFLSKLFCLIFFLIVIIFLNNIYSLIILSCFWFIYRSDTSLFMILLVLSLFISIVINNLIILKIALIVCYGDYFLCYTKVNNFNILLFNKNKSVDFCIDEVNVKDNFLRELKKGRQLKDKEIEFIKSRLEEKNNDIVSSQNELMRMRFYDINTKVKNNFKLDNINGLYIICHLILLIIIIMVE